ncbi:MAG: cysteine--tRNA ligase [Lentisphaerae bacterium]|nr:cysteine--tRNA ligase [Lentisphaerota bacterium]
MPFRILNTMSRQMEDFVPLKEGEVRFYTCGPTVYDFAHIGNFRAYLFEDLLRRQLKANGFRVVQVMNLTDVDDKTIRGSREARVPLREFTEKFKNAFFEDLKTLNVERAEYYPAATDHVLEMIALIQRLFDRGVAYRSDDGSVYFSIAKFSRYGALAHLDMTGLRPGARVAQDESQKDHAADFARWKIWTEEDGDVAWESPWGRGRPGWHIECSAMSMKYLGESFDLHTGGIDNIFPHHEDELAQSEAATGRPFAKYWMHCAHLVVDGKKMSKSLGNFFTLRDLLQRGYSGREIRYALMAAHYRQSLNFTFEALGAARAALGRLDEFRARLLEKAGPVNDADIPDWAEQARRTFRAALDDDLNVSEALAALFQLAHNGNVGMNEGRVSPRQARGALSVMDDMDRVLGFLREADAAVDPRVTRLAEERQAARKAKNWATSDRLRKEIEALGWEIKDTPEGPKLKKK